LRFWKNDQSENLARPLRAFASTVFSSAHQSRECNGWNRMTWEGCAGWPSRLPDFVLFDSTLTEAGKLCGRYGVFSPCQTCWPDSKKRSETIPLPIWKTKISRAVALQLVLKSCEKNFR
jgi:hypothetical protein